MYNSLIKNHNDTVKQSFKKQAEKFAAYHMSKTEYTDYLMKRIGAKGTEHALEVAAGTCICGRALSPFVKDITCLDLTEEMFKKDFVLQCEETILVPVNLKSWMELTDTPEDVQKEITNLMKDELAGGSKTGFSPYNSVKESQIMFDHRWLLLIGEKRH